MFVPSLSWQMIVFHQNGAKTFDETAQKTFDFKRRKKTALFFAPSFPGSGSPPTSSALALLPVSAGAANVSVCSVRVSSTKKHVSPAANE
eukprot:COSAG06_NODE_907_length_11611_cov_13.405316_12_plen_90_part_00